MVYRNFLITVKAAFLFSRWFWEVFFVLCFILTHYMKKILFLLNLSSAKPTKWSNILKQWVFDHFVGLALIGLKFILCWCSHLLFQCLPVSCNKLSNLYSPWDHSLWYQVGQLLIALTTSCLYLIVWKREETQSIKFTL